MTNLLFTFLLTNGFALFTFDAEPWTVYRLQVRRNPSVNTNWLGADFYEDSPYRMPGATLMDPIIAADAWYQLIPLPVNTAR